MVMADQPLANQALLERSLRRSAQLGRQVLDRASRRRGAAGDQDWWSRPSGTTGRQSQSTPSTTQTSVQRTCLDSAFETIAEFMAHTTDQCKNVYQPDCCSDPTEMERSHVRRFHSHPSTRTDPTEMERSHVRRFHSQPSTRTERSHVRRFHSHPSTRTATPALPKRIQGQVSGGGEDFHIEVSPGTYSITAGMLDAVQQTQTVSVHAGQSINLTFNL